MGVSVAEELPHAFDLDGTHGTGEESPLPRLKLCRHDEPWVHVTDVVLAKVGR